MIYAVGDIHGQCQKLKLLLKLLGDDGMQSDDTLVFIGDYVDRGPDSKGVLDLLLDLKGQRPRTIFLRGNHEQMMLHARQRFDSRFDSNNPSHNCDSGVHWLNNGGTETLASYGKAKGKRWCELIPKDHWDFLLSTQLEYQEDGYLFVHAGVLPPGTKWSPPDFEADPRMWIRYEFIASQSAFGGQTVIFGHTPTKDGLPLLMKNKVAIDTGAGYGQPLTAVGLPNPYDPSKVRVFQAKK